MSEALNHPVTQEAAVDPNTVNGQLMLVHQKLSGNNVPTYYDLQDADPLVRQISPVEGGYTTPEGAIDAAVAENVIVNSDPKRWELPDEDFDAYSSVISAETPKDVQLPTDEVAARHQALSEKFVSQLPEGTSDDDAFAQYKDYARKRVVLNEYISDPEDAKERYESAAAPAQESGPYEGQDAKVIRMPERPAVPGAKETPAAEAVAEPVKAETATETAQQSAADTDPDRAIRMARRRVEKGLINRYHGELAQLVRFDKSGHALRENGKRMSQDELFGILESKVLANLSESETETTVAIDQAPPVPPSRQKGLPPVPGTEVNLINGTAEYDAVKAERLATKKVLTKPELTAAVKADANGTEYVFDASHYTPPVPGSTAKTPDSLNLAQSFAEALAEQEAALRKPTMPLDRIYAREKKLYEDRKEGEKNYLDIEDALIEGYAEKKRRESIRGRVMARAYEVGDRFNDYFTDAEKGKRRRVGAVLATGAVALGAAYLANRGGYRLHFGEKAQQALDSRPNTGGAASSTELAPSAPVHEYGDISAENPTISHLAVDHLQETGQAINTETIAAESHRIQEINGITDAGTRQLHNGDHIQIT
jgi:hypothetical protein